MNKKLIQISDLISELSSEIFNLVCDKGSIGVEGQGININSIDDSTFMGVGKTLMVEEDEGKNYVYLEYETPQGIIENIDLFELSDVETLAVYKAIDNIFH